MHRLAAEVDLDPDAARFCVLHGDASRHIVEQEQEQDCDPIVIGKHGRNALEELLLGSVIKHVLAESTCDVMVSVQSTG
jgi:nucleotide-binding universal stress UspA family protein